MKPLQNNGNEVAALRPLPHWGKLFLIFIAGGLFGTGLAISGMTNPARVIGFLDVFGKWDPALLFVMAPCNTGGASGRSRLSIGQRRCAMRYKH